uniref:DIRP domain-containing protein n=1 Tax=Caenorhabditis tropicalis TaxID=1561998 RepID=A0A1I7UED5_9PELO
MIRRKKSNSGKSSRKKRGESSSPARRGSDDVNPPPEFAPYDYESRAMYLLKCLNGQHYPFLSNGFIQLVHELEELLATNNFTRDYMSGEIQFMNEGFYPTPDLNARLMPVYDSRDNGRPATPEDNSEARSARASSVPNEEETAREKEICLLPEEGEDDDFDEYPAYHVGTRFWTWCRKSFMGKIDEQFLENFKEVILDAYSDETLQKYFVNEPWKYRKRIIPLSRRKSLNASNGKKKVSISNEVTSPPNGSRNGARKSSLSGYRIPNRRNSEKEKELLNNNKIMPIIESMVMTAQKEQKDNRAQSDTPTIRRGRSRMTSPEFTRERKLAKIEIDTESEDDDDMLNGSVQRGSSKLHSPRQVKKERFDEEYERMEDGNGNCSTNGMNGHSKRLTSPKRKNGDIRTFFPSVSKPSTSNTVANGWDETAEMPDLDDIDAESLGSRIIAKMIAIGVLPGSSADIFQQMASEENEDGSSVSNKVEMSEEGKDEAEDQEVGELAEELQNLQMNLKKEIDVRKALFMLTWRRAKAHFAFSILSMN